MFRRQLMLVVLLSACQTPAPQTQSQALDDDVVVPNAEPLSEAATAPEPQPDPKPEPKPEESEPKKPVVESHIPKPELPEEMSFQETALARTAQQQRRGLVFRPILTDSSGGGCGIPSAIRASADDGAGYTIDSCLRAVDAAHALTYERHTSKLGVLDFSDVAIVHDGKPIWSVLDACVGLRQDDVACPTDRIYSEVEVHSFTGPVLTYDVLTSRAAAGGPPYAEHTGVTVDVRTGLPAKFDAMIDTSSLLNALKRDSFLRRAVNPVELDAAKTLDDIWKLWGTTTFGHFGSYYFYEWDAKTGQVAMRILFREDTVPGHSNGLKELGVWVLPKRTWRAAFEDAAAKTSGFLAK